MENVKAAMENAGSAGKAEAINYQSVKQKFQSYLKHPGSFAVYILTSLAALITVLVLGFIIVYILVKGVPHLTPDLFAWEYNSENVSMLDGTGTCDSCTDWYIFSYLYGGIRKKRK